MGEFLEDLPDMHSSLLTREPQGAILAEGGDSQRMLGEARVTDLRSENQCITAGWKGRRRTAWAELESEVI